MKAFEAVYAQAIKIVRISVKVVLPNSNQPAVRHNMRNTQKWKSYTMPIVSNTFSWRQSVVIAMVWTAIRAQIALNCRCSHICSAKVTSARFDVAYAFCQCGNEAMNCFKQILAP